MYTSTSYPLRQPSSFIDRRASYLETLRFAEALVGKQLVELIPGLDPVSLVSMLCTEYLRDIDKVPGLDVVVTLIPSVNVPLNGVSLIAYHEAKINVHMSTDSFSSP